ncbi:hypothetical protein F4801DRAFT_563058 [Xylaria longipes]|nr:hypothetical protein F4801DRAFT_563058 [Xylaria longipes]
MLGCQSEVAQQFTVWLVVGLGVANVAVSPLSFQGGSSCPAGFRPLWQVLLLLTYVLSYTLVPVECFVIAGVMK